MLFLGKCQRIGCRADAVAQTVSGVGQCQEHFDDLPECMRIPRPDLRDASIAALEQQVLTLRARRTRPWLFPSERRHLADMITRAITTGPHPPISDAYAMGAVTLREMLLEIPGDLDTSYPELPAQGEGGGEMSVLNCADCRDAERALERWRHGVTIEGDFICPDSLLALDLERALRMALTHMGQFYNSAEVTNVERESRAAAIAAGWKALGV